MDDEVGYRGAVAARAGFVVAGLEPGDVEIDRLAVDDGGDRIEEGERIFAGEGADRLGEGGRGEGPGGDHDAVPIVGRQAGDFLAADFDERVGLDLRLDGGGKSVPVDRQRAARGNLVDVGGGHDDRAAAAHFGVEQADGVVFPVVRPERVGADELGEAFGLMRIGAAHRAHLVQNDGDAGLGRLPGGLGTGQSAANDMNGLEFGHDRRGT